MAPLATFAVDLLPGTGPWTERLIDLCCGIVVAVASGTVVLAIKARRQPATDEDVPASMESARELARSGRRIQAVKMVRDMTGVPLQEAYAIVKAMESEQPPEL